MGLTDPDIGPYAPDAWVGLGSALAPAMLRLCVEGTLDFECESPIEVRLGAEMRMTFGNLVKVVPQFKWLRWRMDFAIVPPDKFKPLLFIECDGAAFHCTPEQLANDRRKEESALAAGIALKRFTGRRIHRDVRGCVDEIRMFVLKRL